MAPGFFAPLSTLRRHAVNASARLRRDRERCEKTHVAHAARVCKRGMCALCTGAVVSVSEGAYGDSYLDDILIGTEDFPDFYCYC